MTIKLSTSQVPEVWHPGVTHTQGRGRSGKLADERTKTVTITHRAKSGLMTLSEAQEWYEGQIPYDNLAKNEDVAARALQWSNHIVSEYRNNTQRVRELWSSVRQSLQGESHAYLGDIDIVPSHELAKSVELMVPRLHHAVHGRENWFGVTGKSQMEERTELEIIAFLAWQLRAAGCQELEQPLIRYLLAYQVAGLKLKWDRVVEQRIIRDLVESRTGDQTTYKILRKEAEVLTFEGPRYRLVSPWDLIVDTRSITPEDMEYVGDISEPTLGELRREQTMGIYANVDKIKSKPGRPVQDHLSGWEKLQSSLTDDGAGRAGAPGAPRRVRLVELWGMFDIFGDGNEHECVVTTANGQVCLRAQRNPLDDKMRPYAIGRTAKWGEEFFNVGVADMTLQIEKALDRIRSIAQRGAFLSMSPIIHTEQEGDFPPSIFDIQPGSVFSGGGKITPITISADLRAFGPWVQMLKNDHEEIFGAPRVYEGNAQSGTATEQVTNIEQADKRTAGLVLAVSMLWRQAIDIQYRLNRQFSTTPVEFRVLGKMATRLRKKWHTMTPASFLPEIDVEITALKDVFNASTRASAIGQWVQQWAPLLPAVQGQINLPKLLRMSFEGAVGSVSDDVFQELPLPGELPSQLEENEMLLGGQEIGVNEMDPHQDHIEDMRPVIKLLEDGELDSRTARFVVDHLLGHMEGMQRQANEAKVRARMDARNAPPAPPPEVGDQAEGEMGFGGSDVAQTPVGETPGPGTAGQQAKPGRGGPQPQATNRVGA